MLKNSKNRSIVFYNVENLFDIHDDKGVSDFEFTPKSDKNWNEKKYTNKINAIANVLNNIPSTPILIGLTEVENRQVVEDLIHNTSLKEHSYRIIHQNSPDNRGIDVCLIYDSSFIKSLNSEFLRITFPWNNDIKTRDVLFFRCEINSERIWIVVNHWPSRRDGADATEDKRLHVASKVREKLEQIMSKFPEDKILIMGDFNDEPKNKSIERILKAKLDKNIREDEFYNLMADPNKNEEGTSTHMGEWLTIDQIMVNRNFLQNKNDKTSILNNKATIYTKEDVLYYRPNGNCKPNQLYGGDHYLGGISDHLPVYVVLD